MFWDLMKTMIDIFLLCYHFFPRQSSFIFTIVFIAFAGLNVSNIWPWNISIFSQTCPILVNNKGSSITVSHLLGEFLKGLKRMMRLVLNPWDSWRWIFCFFFFNRDCSVTSESVLCTWVIHVIFFFKGTWTIIWLENTSE